METMFSYRKYYVDMFPCFCIENIIRIQFPSSKYNFNAIFIYRILSGYLPYISLFIPSLLNINVRY